MIINQMLAIQPPPLPAAFSPLRRHQVDSDAGDRADGDTIAIGGMIEESTNLCPIGDSCVRSNTGGRRLVWLSVLTAKNGLS